MASDLFGLFQRLKDLWKPELVDGLGTMTFVDGAGHIEPAVKVGPVQAPPQADLSERYRGLLGLVREDYPKTADRVAKEGRRAWNDIKNDPGIGPVALEAGIKPAVDWGALMAHGIMDAEGNMPLVKKISKALAGRYGVGDPVVLEEIEGAVQDGLMHASGSANTIKDADKIPGFYWTAGENKAKDFLTKRGLMAKREVELPSQEVLSDALPTEGVLDDGAEGVAPAGGPNALQTMLNAEREAELADRLRGLMERMPPQERAVLEAKASGTPSEARGLFPQFDPLQYSKLVHRAQESAQWLRDAGTLPEDIRAQALEQTLAKFADPVYKVSPLQRMLERSVNGASNREIAKELGTTEAKVQAMLAEAKPKFEKLAQRYTQRIIATRKALMKSGTE